MISVIIPVFNEEDTIEECLMAVVAAPYDKQIIVVDDASTDGTRDVLRLIEKKIDFTLLAHDRNKGKGAAVRTAQKETIGETVIIQDGDMEYDPNDYAVVLQPIIDKKKKAVYGSRNLRRNRRYSIAFYLGGRLITLIANIIYKTRLTDLNTCYKGFEGNLFRSIPLSDSRFDFCEEITAKVSRMGYEIAEVPIKYNPRTIGEGKKIRPTDALRAIMTLLRYRSWNLVDNDRYNREG